MPWLTIELWKPSQGCEDEAFRAAAAVHSIHVSRVETPTDKDGLLLKHKMSPPFPVQG